MKKYGYEAQLSCPQGSHFYGIRGFGNYIFPSFIAT